MNDFYILPENTNTNFFNVINLYSSEQIKIVDKNIIEHK